MNIRLIIVLLLSLLLSTSSFSLINSLTSLLASTEYKLEPKQYNSQYLLSLDLDLPAAQYQYFNELDNGSLKWRLFAEKLARNDADIAWQLAQYYADKQQARDHQYWFDKALALGSADALITEIKVNVQQQASKEGYLAAKALLDSLIDTNEDALILSTHLAIAYNDQQQLDHNVEKLTFVKGKQLLNLIRRYKVFDSSSSILTTQKTSSIDLNKPPFIPTHQSSCENKIQFFATSIQALTRLEQQIASITADPFFEQQFCFATPRFIAKAELNCSHSINQRIECDETIWQNQGLDSDVKYLGVVVEAGGANVNHGILYLDWQDRQQVIEHELMHLIGFIDEYPLHINHDVCAQASTGAIANNVLLSHEQYFDNQQQARSLLLMHLPWRDLVAEDTPLTTPEKVDNTIKYKIGTPTTHKNKVGLFPAKTCTKQAMLTFKPLNLATKLEYFEENLPKQYKTLSLNATDTYNMPSYQYNIGLALVMQKRREQAQLWFVKSAQLETNQHRQKVISQGGF